MYTVHNQQLATYFVSRANVTQWISEKGTHHNLLFTECQCYAYWIARWATVTDIL